MASVNLPELYMHEASNLAVFVTTDGFAQEDENSSVPGEVRTYAGGRRRLVTRVAKVTSLQVTFPACARSTAAWLRDRTGVALMLRDPSGRVEWGVYFSLAVSEKGSGQDPEVSFTFESISGSAAV